MKEVTNKDQKALDYIFKWCGVCGFKVCIAKSSVVLFFRNITSRKVELKFDGKMLKTENKVQFLGRIFDSRLSQKNHIDHVVGKCNKMINLLKVLACSRWWWCGGLCSLCIDD